MSNLLATLAPYAPPAVVRAVAAEPRLPDRPQIERLPAAVLFADVSGFTPLTEALAQRGARGPEELTTLLNQYFTRMIDLIEAEGGEVVKFAGDAVMVLFPAGGEPLGYAVRRAAQAADAMQMAMTEFAQLQTSAGPVALGMKVGLGAGEVLVMQVGGVLDRWEYVIAGDVLRQVAEAEKQAERGDIILSPGAQAARHPDPLPARPLPQPDWPAVPHPAAVADVLQHYVPGPVRSWLERGLHAWLADFRAMGVMFIGVKGLNYDRPDILDKLHAFLSAAQTVIYRYQGTVNRLAVDDKGTVLLVLVGAPPFSHEDDALRTVRCGLDLQQTARQHELELAIGITSSRIFSGPVGSTTRREYTVMGDAVNLAARLMSQAGPSGILCDEDTRRKTQQRIAFDTLSPVKLKGKSGLIPIFRPTDATQRQAVQARMGFLGRQKLVGRQAEVAHFQAVLAAVASDQSRVLILEGEAGIGKSRLIAEFIPLLEQQGMTALLGAGRSMEQETPFRAWRDIMTAFFNLSETTPPADQQQQVTAQVQAINPALVERLSLLNDILNLGLPDTELTANLEPTLRYQSLVSLMIALFQSAAGQSPPVIILEDAYWLDATSWDLTLQLVRGLTVIQSPFLLMAAVRPPEGLVMRPEPIILAQMDLAERLVLDTMPDDEIRHLAAARLGVSLDHVPAALTDLICQRAGGNPFYAEEVIHLLQDQAIIRLDEPDDPTPALKRLTVGDLTTAVQQLPHTIQQVVQARIDRLPPEEQLTIKVAAVLGRTFTLTMLRDILAQYAAIEPRRLRAYMDDLTYLDLLPVETTEPEITYIFKHIITQEVAYSTLLFSQRHQLHLTVAEWYEVNYGGQLDALAPYYPLLVHHYHHAEDAEQERHYAGLAGQQAARQYANAEAIRYFSRALILTPENDLAAQYELRLARERVHDLRGEREAQQQDLIALAALVEPDRAEALDSRRVEIALRQAHYAETTGDYPAATISAERALAESRAQGALLDESRSLNLLGLIARRQGRYDAAISWYEQAITVLSGNTLEADQLSRALIQALNGLGIVLRQQGDFSRARQYYERALTLSRQIGDRRLEAELLNSLGVTAFYRRNLAEAIDFYQQALLIRQTIGDRGGVGTTLFNLATAIRNIGDYGQALDYYREALAIQQAVDNRWEQVNIWNSMGIAYQELGNFAEAQSCLARGVELAQAIGDEIGVAYLLANMGLAAFEQGHYSAATAYQRDGLDIAVRHDDKYLVTLYRYYGGLIDLQQGRLPQAAEQAQRSLQLQLASNSRLATTGNLALLGKIYQLLDDIPQALTYTHQALAILEECQGEGPEFPHLDYFFCYQVLTAAGQADRARSALEMAHHLVMKRANKITDPALRQSFLEQVASNREIVAAYQEHISND
ncbi:MAG: tetratricopeptide repeat protein [Anaerolineae bacterium]|nr:tetratricopeptide repeat protein [Anaerolineae bacterium]